MKYPLSGSDENRPGYITVDGNKHCRFNASSGKYQDLCRSARPAIFCSPLQFIALSTGSIKAERVYRSLML